METEKNEKVLAMYRAVRELMEEGRDIHELKVSDITERAGIGKGTAYEYFRSKEELLQRAAHYDFLLQYAVLEQKMNEQDTLKGAVESCFSWLEDQSGKLRMAEQFLKMTARRQQGSGADMGECMRQRMEDGIKLFQGTLNVIIKLGKAEKLFGEGIPDSMIEMEICAKVLIYFFYLAFMPAHTEEECRITKEQLYETILKSLR